MKVYGVWHGGSSYAQPNMMGHDLESWNSVLDAKLALEDRYRGSWNFFRFVNRLPVDTRTPAVDAGSEIRLVFAEPYDPPEGTTSDLKYLQGCTYKRLYFGPKLGIKVENL